MCILNSIGKGIQRMVRIWERDDACFQIERHIDKANQVNFGPREKSIKSATSLEWPAKKSIGLKIRIEVIVCVWKLIGNNSLRFYHGRMEQSSLNIEQIYFDLFNLYSRSHTQWITSLTESFARCNNRLSFCWKNKRNNQMDV